MAVTRVQPQGSPNPRGEALAAELKWVHDMIRRDLRTVRELASGAAAGRPATEIQDGIRGLAAASPLWQLKINCLMYCRFVHSHHHAESAMLFPALRRSNPALEPVVDKLEADHLAISGLLGDVEAAARALAGQDSGQDRPEGGQDRPEGGQQRDPARDQLVTALQALSTDLLEHLRYEEDNISGTLRTWTAWPFW